jgi:hypothetical protein
MIKVPEKDVQMLSEYLDGQLAPADRQKLETRLHSNAELRETYDDLRRLRGMLRALPRRKVPHNFTLTRAMAAEARRVSGWFPLLRFSSAAAALAAVVLMAIQLLPGAARLNAPASAPAPAALQAAPPQAAQENSVSGQPTPTVLIFQWGAGATGLGGGGAEGSGLLSAPAAKAIPPGYGEGGGPTEAAPEFQAQPLLPLEPTPSAEQPNPAAALPTESAATAMPAASAAPAAPPAGTQDSQADQFILGLPAPQDEGKITLPETASSPQVQTDAYSTADRTAAPSASLPLDGILAGGLALVAVAAGLAAYFIRRR